MSPEMLVGKTLDELFPKGIHAAPLPGEDDEVRTIIAVAQNVTEHKRAEEERERRMAQEWKAHAQAEERKRISRELHDRVAHAMAFLRPASHWIRSTASPSRATKRSCRLTYASNCS